MTFESLAIRHQHTKPARVLFTLLQLGVVATMVALLASGPGHDDATMGTALIGGLVCAALFVGALWARGGLRGTGGTVDIAGDSMTLRTRGRRSVVPMDEIAAGIAIPTKDGCIARIERKNGDVELVTVRDADTAAALLEALRIDPAHRRYTVRWTTMTFGVVAALIAVPSALCVVLALSSPRILEALLSPFGVMFAIYALLPVFATWLVRLLGWREVGVGTDGLFLRAGRSKRYIRFAEIASMQRGVPIRAVLRSGGRIKLPTPDGQARRDALIERIVSARAAALATPEAMAELLARRGRPVGEWRDQLVKQLQGSGYRHAPLTRETAFRILGDPRADAEQRIAAALALSGSEDPDAPSRIRVAADACASPKLRVALETLVEGDADEAIEAALAGPRAATSGA